MGGNILRSIVFSLWLPVAVLVVSFIRFGIGGGGMPPGMTDFLWLFALAWPAGIPLTLAVTLLHKRSRVIAYICAAVLAPVAVLGVTAGGLLGPVGVIGYALVASLPAWITLGILTIFKTGTPASSHP